MVVVHFLVASKVARYKAFNSAVFTWKYASLTIQFPVCGVQWFYRICCINDLPDSVENLKNWRNSIPVVLPAFHGIRVFRSPFFSYTFQGSQSLLLISGLIDGFLNLQQKAFLSLSGTYFRVFLTWWTIHLWYSVLGNAAEIASLMPVRHRHRWSGYLLLRDFSVRSGLTASISHFHCHQS